MLLVDIARTRVWPKVRLGQTSFIAQAVLALDGSVDLRLVHGTRTILFRGRDPKESFLRAIRSIRESNMIEELQ